MANCTNCNPSPLPPLPDCGSCGNCSGCVEPDIVHVRRTKFLNSCDVVLQTLKGYILSAVGNPVTCSVQFGTPVVSNNNISLAPTGYSGAMEYSRDGVLFQDSPLFTNFECGTHKLYIRQKNNTDCIVAGYATVNYNCACIPNWQNTENPPLDNCIGNVLHYRQNDGCGHSEWKPSQPAIPCGCIPKWVPTTDPVTTKCEGGFVWWRITDGCGKFEWEKQVTTCVDPAQCVSPNSAFAATTISATCNQAGQILTNASFVLTAISNADRYALSPGPTYNGPNYANAIEFTGPTLVVNGLTGYDHDHSYILRLFNGNDECIYDRPINFLGTTCNPACVLPHFVLEKVDPTCTGSVGSNGILKITEIQNATRWQLCESGIFDCPPNYNAATPITGTSVNLATNIGFAANQQYRDFTVRVYNGSQGCFVDATLRFSNPCFGSGCIEPTFSAITGIAATCTGSTLNNNASITLADVTNAVKYGHSNGPTYGGPTWGSAPTVPGANFSITGLPGSSAETQRTVRLYRTLECYVDIVVEIPGRNCESSCVNPTGSAGTGTAATCTGSTPNNDAKMLITNVANTTKFGFSPGNTYTGPNYSSATTYPGTGDLEFLALAGSNSAQPYTIRMFNGNNECRTDKTIIIPASVCAPECVPPTYTSKSATPATCSGATPNNNAIINIVGISAGMTKYGIVTGDTYTGGPNYAAATAATGTALNLTGLAGSTGAQTKTIRIFKTATCYLDVTQVIGASSCEVGCVNPTFTLTHVPETCTDGVSNGNGILRISGISNGTKYQQCLFTNVFNCTPNYEGSPTISGSGPIDVNTGINTTGEDSISVVVRVYNGSASCFTDHTIEIENPCDSCCNMTINSATLTNI